MIGLVPGTKMKVWCHTSYRTGYNLCIKFDAGNEYELTIEKGVDFISCKIQYNTSLSWRFSYTKHGLYDPINCPLYTDYFYDIYTHRNNEINKILSEEDI